MHILVNKVCNETISYNAGTLLGEAIEVVLSKEPFVIVDFSEVINISTNFACGAFSRFIETMSFPQFRKKILFRMCKYNVIELLKCSIQCEYTYKEKRNG